MHFVRHWHARFGVVSAVFIFLLASTGLALNHTEDLGLAKRTIAAPWLMQWYGLKSVVPKHGYLFEGGYLAISDGRWVMDGRPLLASKQPSVGAVQWGELRAIANADTLYLYQVDGQLVDKVSGADLPNKLIERLGILDHNSTPKLTLATPQGNFVSEDGLTWQPLEKAQPLWSSEQVLPSALSAGLNQAFKPSLPLERIILDLHSGRIFGRYGVALMDVSAIVLILLSVSGVWIYMRSARRKKTKH